MGHPEVPDAAPLAREHLLRWLLALPAALDPAEAAGMLLSRLDSSEPADSALAEELRRLVEEVERYPRDALHGHFAGAARRRGVIG